MAKTKTTAKVREKVPAQFLSILRLSHCFCQFPEEVVVVVLVMGGC